MKSRKRRLEFIRSKNRVKKMNHNIAFWHCENKNSGPPFKWLNLKKNILEEAWIIDLGFRK